MAGVLLQTRWWQVLPASLLLLYVARVCERLLGIHSDIGHIVWRKVVLWWHPPARLLGRKVGTRGLFWGIDRVWVIDTVLASSGRLGSVEAGL